MASYGYTFSAGDTVTPTKLNNARTVSDIVNADISATAAIAATKLASDSITNTQIKSDAAIAGTKIAPNFGSQNIVTTGGAATGSATLTAGGAALTLVNSSAAANQKNWDLVTTAVGLQIRARNDAGAGGGNTFDFTRSSEQVNEFSGSNSGNKWFVVDNANQRVGIGGTANAAAILDASSTTKGFLPPRMTTAQRDAISTPPAGLMIYNTSTNVLNFYNGSAWGAV